MSARGFVGTVFCAVCVGSSGGGLTSTSLKVNGAAGGSLGNASTALNSFTRGKTVERIGRGFGIFTRNLSSGRLNDIAAKGFGRRDRTCLAVGDDTAGSAEEEGDRDPISAVVSDSSSASPSGAGLVRISCVPDSCLNAAEP